MYLVVARCGCYRKAQALFGIKNTKLLQLQFQRLVEFLMLHSDKAWLLSSNKIKLIRNLHSLQLHTNAVTMLVQILFDFANFQRVLAYKEHRGCTMLINLATPYDLCTV